jgi:hypothetical protein
MPVKFCAAVIIYDYTLYIAMLLIVFLRNSFEKTLKAL